mmetsp:Transcript_12723/g.38376  ORF Transcript_12723/g.38376 Transcript_12723/m.38376 type:complete len:230 (-) Transcript_12723:493-1182(-)
MCAWRYSCTATHSSRRVMPWSVRWMASAGRRSLLPACASHSLLLCCTPLSAQWAHRHAIKPPSVTQPVKRVRFWRSQNCRGWLSSSPDVMTCLSPTCAPGARLSASAMLTTSGLGGGPAAMVSASAGTDTSGCTALSRAASLLLAGGLSAAGPSACTPTEGAARPRVRRSGTVASADCPVAAAAWPVGRTGAGLSTGLSSRRLLRFITASASASMAAAVAGDGSVFEGL